MTPEEHAAIIEHNRRMLHPDEFLTDAQKRLLEIFDKPRRLPIFWQQPNMEDRSDREYGERQAERTAERVRD